MTLYSPLFRGVCLFVLHSIILTSVVGHLRHGHRHLHDYGHGQDHDHGDTHHHHDHHHHLESDISPTNESYGDGSHADIFDSCFVACYSDIVDRYGIEFANQLRADGFTYENCENDNDTSTTADQYANITDGEYYANGTAISGQQRALHRILGATNQLHRLWLVTSYRDTSSRKLNIPYAIKATEWFTPETHETIRIAMETIENATGVIQFVPRTSSQTEYIYFTYEAYYARACAAQLGKQTRSKTSVYLGWCKEKRHLGNIVHELLHALGFWHEHSRPDRDDHVTINWDYITSSSQGNFAKATMVNSLGSPYDFNSIMHYPTVSFATDGRTPTIVPLEPLAKWETMGQRAQLSEHDVDQLRLLYQCSTGPRGGDLSVDELCSKDCPCWEFAMGDCHGDDGECMGDLVCRATPSLSNKNYRDKLPYYTTGSGSFSCDDYCHIGCCGYSNAIILCPETCDTAPPAKALGVIPQQMCVKDDGSTPANPTASPSKKPTTAPSKSPSKEPSRSPTPLPTDGPSTSPSKAPTHSPTDMPTGAPITESPVASPSMSMVPTYAPSTNPSNEPTTTIQPTSGPTKGPSRSPTMGPTGGPSLSPTTNQPSTEPTKGPSRSPTENPTKRPSLNPTMKPTKMPTRNPTKKPTNAPSVTPPASGVWYVDWDIKKCVRDCVGERPCRNRRKRNWEAGYPTDEACCANMHYMSLNKCSYDPTIEERNAPLDTKWYPGTATCLNDGEAPLWQRNKHNTQSQCCSSHFNWNYNNCMGLTPVMSGKWFISWAKGKCMKECDESQGGSCGGPKPGSWIVTHADANACCGAHMSYTTMAACKFNG